MWCEAKLAATMSEMNACNEKEDSYHVHYHNLCNTNSSPTNITTTTTTTTFTNNNFESYGNMDYC